MEQKKRRLFGTDGIRGVANSDPMTPEMSLKLGKALTHILKTDKPELHTPKIVIGKDTRLSGYMFEQALSSGIASMGADVLLVGPLPTPAGQLDADDAEPWGPGTPVEYLLLEHARLRDESSRND